MKKGWEVKKLGDVCEKASSNVSQNQLTNENGDFPIYGASGFIKNIGFYHQDKEYVSIVKDGAGIGRVSLLPAYSSVIGTLQYLIPKKKLNICYFYYFLSNIDFLRYKNGSTIPHLYFKDYAIEPILLPPLHEQHRIVSILDKAFESIATAKENAEKNLKNAKEIFESYLNEVFEKRWDGWEVKNLGEIASFRNGMNFTKVSKGETIEGSKILRGYYITAGKIQVGGRAKPLIADYVLVYKGLKLAVIEAKRDESEVGEGVAQAKNYAEKLHIER